MKLLIELDEEYVKVIDEIKFLVGGRTNRKLQLEIIKAIKNGIPLEQEPTTKNDLGVDCISREQAKVAIRDKFKDIPSRVEINTILNELPSVTPQPCEDAVSRQEVLDLIADYDLSMGQVVRGIHALLSVTPQLSSELAKNSKKLEKDFGELDCIDRAELLKAMDTWDKFGYTARYGLERLDKDDKGFVPYVKYDDMVNCVKGMPSVTPQEPRKGHWIDKQHLFESCSAECSSCHKRSNGYAHDNGFSLEFKYFDFCPKCGSDNREVEE